MMHDPPNAMRQRGYRVVKGAGGDEGAKFSLLVREGVRACAEPVEVGGCSVSERRPTIAPPPLVSAGGSNPHPRPEGTRLPARERGVRYPAAGAIDLDDTCLVTGNVPTGARERAIGTT